MLYSAPDVAKTHLLVETLMVLFIALLVPYFPKNSPLIKFSSSRVALVD